MKSSHGNGAILTVIGAVTFVAGAFTLLTHIQNMRDWVKLDNYVPPTAIVQLANQDHLTSKARHLLYINHPAIEDKPTFNGNCDKFGEQTIVLGCYQGIQNGIHVLSVSDDRLAGVEQVTLAHETLHAVYDRLNSNEKTRVNALLQDYANTKLTDERIKSVLKDYQKTEPGQQLNEMHSIFGTELGNLPEPLEQYYAQYFSNRKDIVAYANQYQSAFTTRQASIQQYDLQLATLGTQVKAHTAQLSTQQAQIDSASQTLEAYKSQGKIQQYNSGVGSYNLSIDAYNALLAQTKQEIDEYNQIVMKRNTIATQTQELQKAIDSSSLPQSK